MDNISNWTVFSDKSHVTRRHTMTVSLGPNRSLYLNRVVFRALSEPKAVELLFDEFNKRIGIRPVDPKQPNSRAVRDHGGKGYCITLAGFCTRFGIRIGSTIRFFDPFVNTEDILVLDLKKTFVTTRPSPRPTMI